MSRVAQGPWYRAAKDAWCLTVEGKSVSLAIKGRKNRKAAIEEWHRRMNAPKPPEAPLGVAKVSEVVEAYLSDAKGRLRANPYQSNRWILDAFSEVHGDVKAESLTVAEVLAYSNRPGWSQA